MDTREHLYVEGRWQTPHGRETLDVVSASTEAVIGRVPLGDPSDVDTAVAAARAAFEGPWGRTTPAERSAWLAKLQHALEARADRIADTVTAEVGMPRKLSRRIQAGLPVLTTKLMARLATELELEEEIGHSLVLREPVGVVGAITPWNYPLHQVMAKVAPALAAGNTVVLKPSEVAPLSAFLMADAVHEVGLPAGVVNVVVGEGPVVGEAIAAHPDVDMVSFTGSLRAGRRVAAVAADTVKRVTLELGGKSAYLVLDDAPFEKAIPAGVKNVLLNSGQTCSAWSRMLVPRSRHAEAVELATATMDAFVLGDPFDDRTTLGPLVSAAQRARVEGYVEAGRAEGARLVRGGTRPPAQDRGFYLEPTLFADVAPHMTIAQEEIFGPVLSVLPYETEDDAVRIANDTIYGLAGGVWSADEARAMRIARRLRTGQVDVNGGAFNALAPFGGYKRSGYGRELGRFGLEEYLEVKSIQRRQKK